MTDYTSAHWASSALLVIDMQVDFAEGGACPVPGTAAITANVRRLAAGYRGAGLPLVHIVRLYIPGASDVDPPRRAMIEAGAEVVAPATPTPWQSLNARLEAPAGLQITIFEERGDGEPSRGSKP